MKKVLFVMVLCLMMLGLKAQPEESSPTYLLGLWYGNSLGDCEECLAQTGFVYSRQNSDGAEMYIPDGSANLGLDIDAVLLYFENGRDELTNWAVCFNRSTDYDVEQEVNNFLTQLHGAGTYSEDIAGYYWEFDDNHMLAAQYNHAGNLFIAEYGTVFDE